MIWTYDFKLNLGFPRIHIILSKILSKIWNFDKNLEFCQKLEFCRKFGILWKIWNFVENLEFCGKFVLFFRKLGFLAKCGILDQNISQ